MEIKLILSSGNHLSSTFLLTKHLNMIVFLIHSTEMTKRMEHMAACVRSHCDSSPKAGAPLGGGVTVCGHVTETLRPCNSVPFTTCIKDGVGGVQKAPEGPCRKSPLPSQLAS